MINILGGLIPTIFWLMIFIITDKKRKERDYKKLIFLFMIGGIGSYLCYRLEMHYGGYFKKVKDSNYFEILIYAIGGVAIFEEGYKWFIALLFNQKKEKQPLEHFYQAIYISLGFSTIENILFYAIPYGIEVSIARIKTAYISHIINAIWMGFFLEKANNNSIIKKRFYQMSGLIIPVMTHALYNSFLYGNKYKEFFQIYYLFLIISGIIATILLKKQNLKVEKK